MLYVGMLLLLVAIVCVHPLWLLRISYRGPVRLPPQMDAPTLILCTHDYEHVDLFCMEKEAKRWKRDTCLSTQFVVADRMHNHLFCDWVHRGACIAVRGGTTDRVGAALRGGYHVCMFVYRHVQSTGAYFMAQWPRVLVARVRCPGVSPAQRERGSSVASIVRATYGRSVSVEYETLERRPDECESPTAFVAALKGQLYGLSAPPPVHQ